MPMICSGLCLLPFNENLLAQAGGEDSHIRRVSFWGAGHLPSYFAGDATDLSRALDAVVPGEVHMDLLRHGMIPDFERDANVLATRWVEECLWLYRLEFKASAEMTQAAHA